MAGKCEHGLTTKECFVCASPRYGAQPVQEPVAPFGRVAVYANNFPNHAPRYEFYPWPHPPYLDNASECHTVYLAAPPQPVQEPPTLADVLDALQVFNKPKASEGGDPWTEADFIAVTALPAFIHNVGRAWYAAPPQPVPLPAHQIVTMYAECPRSDGEMIEFAREVERAHGIGGKP